jgi:hypothetical protein
MRRVVIGASIAFLISTACGDTPTAPSDPGGGVTLFSDTGFRGEQVTFALDVDDLLGLRGGCDRGEDVEPRFSWNDCASSIRIRPGWSVTVYEDTRFRGESRTFTADVSDLEDMRGPCGNDWDDCVSSLRVARP